MEYNGTYGRCMEIKGAIYIYIHIYEYTHTMHGITADMYEQMWKYVEYVWNYNKYTAHAWQYRKLYRICWKYKETLH